MSFGFPAPGISCMGGAPWEKCGRFFPPFLCPDELVGGKSLWEK